MVEQVAAGDECAHLGIGHAPRQHPEPAIGVDEDDPLRPQEAGRTLDPPPGLATRTIEFVPEVAGDWAMHCHMTHHVMNQMGHAGPPMLGVDAARLNRQVGGVVPGYMTMGEAGMGGMGEMPMPMPPNSLPMRGAAGPFSYIDMGGMFTVLKVRDNPTEADKKAWYKHPAGTVAGRADPARMKQDGIDPKRKSRG